MDEIINHPAHYGGDTVYEVIKVIEAWELGFHLGNAVKYIARVGKKLPGVLTSDEEYAKEIARKVEIEDLKKARFYLDRQIEQLENVG
jgi:hypothetical protein